MHDVRKGYAFEFYVKPWEEVSKACKRCYFALFLNVVMNYYKLASKEDDLDMGTYFSQVSPAIEGLIIATLQVQGSHMIKGREKEKGSEDEPNKTRAKIMDSHKAEVWNHRKNAYDRRKWMMTYCNDGDKIKKPRTEEEEQKR